MKVNNEDPTVGTAVTVESSQALRAEPRIQPWSCSSISPPLIAARAAATTGGAPSAASPHHPASSLFSASSSGSSGNLTEKTSKVLLASYFLRWKGLSMQLLKHILLAVVSKHAEHGSGAAQRSYISPANRAKIKSRRADSIELPLLVLSCRARPGERPTPPRALTAWRPRCSVGRWFCRGRASYACHPRDTGRTSRVHARGANRRDGCSDVALAADIRPRGGGTPELP